MRYLSDDVIKYILNFCDWGNAAKQGSLGLIILLSKYKYKEYNNKVICFAAAFGYLEIIKYLHENGFKTKCNAMDCAAKYGHLDVLKYLHFNNIGICTTRAMDWAAENGYLDVVEFLHYNRSEGCTTDAIDLAAKFKYLRVVEWLLDHRKEGYTSVAISWVKYNNDLKLFYIFNKKSKQLERI